jgi:hypothetical protein
MSILDKPHEGSIVAREDLSVSMGQQGDTSQHGLEQRRLEELPRPVVTFVTGGCKISLRQALVSCLRELEKEGIVRFEPDAGGIPVISVRASEPRSGRSLLPFEKVTLERVSSRSGGQANIPLSALLSNDGDDYSTWKKSQVNEIAQEARRAGLARKRLPEHTWWGILALIAVAIAAIVIHQVHPKGTAVTGGIAFYTSLALLIATIRLYRWRLTPEGVAAVDSWRRDGGGVPGAAHGAGATGEKTIWGLTAPGGAPLPPGHAWSSLGGQWHTVRLGHALKRPYWSGLRGLRLILGWTAVGSFFTVIAGLTQDMNANGKLLAIAPAAVGALVILALWLPAFAMRMNLPDSVTFTGQVVKRWFVDGGEYSPDHDWICIDDGSGTAMKFDIPPDRYFGYSAGDTVRVTWSPRRRCLLDIGR